MAKLIGDFAELVRRRDLLFRVIGSSCART